MGEITYQQFATMAKRFRAAKEWSNEFGCYYNMYKMNPEIARQDIVAFRARVTAEMGNAKNNYERLRKVLKESYRVTAYDNFDDYCIYIEFERPFQQRFYLPRRKQLLPIAEALQRLETDDGIELVTISLPPGVGKSTLAIFYLSWIGGRSPNEPSLCSSHSSSILYGFYNEVYRVIAGGEYLWGDVFKGINVVGTNAADLRIDLDRPKRFETFEFSSLNAGNAGKVRAKKLLYCDDLVANIEEALSKPRMDKLWQTYTTDLRQRKQGKCKELHIATRWSIYDPIGRLQQMYAGSNKAIFIAIPALDENDESNFDYPYDVGFSTEFYHKQREVLDDASWRALYMNEPIEREGTLFDGSEMRRYFELPGRDPDAILAVCDTADGGGDYWTMPIAYKYGQDYYIDHIVYDNGKPNIVENKIVNVLVDKKVDMARFESNRAGGRVAERIQKEIKLRSGRTRITTKWSQSNKETRIIVSSGYIKEHFLFKDPSVYEQEKEYRLAMQNLFSYSMAGKNIHDDFPDALSMLADWVGDMEGNKVTVCKRPW